MPKGWKVSVNRRVKPKMRTGAIIGLGLATEHILGVSNENVPIEEGTLERSGTTSIDEANLQGGVSYDTPYATRQHEAMDYRHDAGRNAKFLENAFNSETKVARELIAASIRGELK